MNPLEDQPENQLDEPECNKVVRGTISPEQIRGELRQGDSSVVLMAKGLFTGKVLTTDECGNAVETDDLPETIPFSTNSVELCRVIALDEPPPIVGDKPPDGTPLAATGPLFSVVEQAWLFNEPPGTMTLKEYKKAYTAAIQVQSPSGNVSARMVAGSAPDGISNTVHMNGGYEYPAQPHELPVAGNGSISLSAPFPTMNVPVLGPSNNLDVALMSWLIRFKLDVTTNYNKARTCLMWKGTAGSQPSAHFSWYQSDVNAYHRQYWMQRGSPAPSYCDSQQSILEGAMENIHDGNWHTMVWVTAPMWDSGGYTVYNIWKLYLDGVQIITPQMPYNSTPGVIGSNAGLPLTFGGMSNGNFGHPPWGYIDTIQFFNRLLTTSEVKALSDDPYLIWRPDADIPPPQPPEDPKLWLKADTIMATNGQTITTWNDTSPSGRNATVQAGVFTYLTNQINGKPAVQFSASAYALFTAIPTWVEHTCFAVFKPASGTKGMLIGGGSNAFGYWVGQNGGRLQGCDRSGVTQMGTGTATRDNNWHQASVRQTDNVGAFGFTLKFRLDGVNDVVMSQSPAVANGSITRLGMNGANSGEFFGGLLAELIYYDRTMTDTEVGEIEAYLQAKYFTP